MNRVFYAVLIIVGVSLIVMPLSVPVFKSGADYSVLNTGWRGTSDFGRLLYSRGQVSPVLSTYDSSGLAGDRGTLVVIGPNLGFTGGEVKALRTFLEKGNTLLLAGSFGTGNQLLKGLGLKERFSKESPVTPIYLKNGNFTITDDITDERLARNVSMIVMYRPAVILNPQNPVVYTSNATRLGGSYGSFAVVDVVPYGKGKIILVSDPDIFTNSLFAENRAFIENLLYYLPGPFYIDEAHHRDFNPYSSGTITIRRAVNRRLVFYYILFVAGLAFLIESGLWLRILERLLSVFSRFFKEEGEGLEEIVKSLEEEGFDGRVLERIVEEIRTGSKLGGGNGR